MSDTLEPMREVFQKEESGQRSRNIETEKFLLNLASWKFLVTENLGHDVRFSMMGRT